MWRKLKNLVARDRVARREGEDDAPNQSDDLAARPSGGTVGPDTQDANSSTGTTYNQTFVGRAGGDEAGDSGISGAEARGDGDLDSQGAARRE